MVSLEDCVTAGSSTALRVLAYVFLRWIPGHDIPPIIFTLFAVYLPSFILDYLSTSPHKVLLDEYDIIITENGETRQPPALPSVAAHSQNIPDDEKPEVFGVDIIETMVLRERGAHAIKTLLTGLPSPTSNLLSALTVVINFGIVLMVADLVFRARMFHPSHDVSFVRVGYVSDNTAKLLVREANSSNLPMYLSYRVADSPKLADLEPSHKFQKQDSTWRAADTIYFLTNETDYTTTVTLTNLSPETRYQYATSSNSNTNQTGFFTTAQASGYPVHRNRGRFTFLSSSCIKPRFPYNPFKHPLSIPGFKFLAERIPQLKPQFMLFLGDFIYIDAPWRHGSDAEAYRRDYRQVYASSDWPSVSQELPWIHVLDDHEIENDWVHNTTGVYPAAADPWSHYHVAVNPPEVRPDASYFSFAQGPASFFLLDTRKYRTPATSNATTKTMLGETQLADLLAWLRKAEPRGVKWKILASSIPFTKNWHFGGNDTWGGYPEERQIVLEAMWDVGLRGGVGVIVLSGDRHEFAATSFPPPLGGKWPLAAAVHEFSTSPLSQFYLPVRTYKQVDEHDVLIKYLPDGNSKFGAIEIESPQAAEQSLLKYRLFIDGEEVWDYILTTPPNFEGGGRDKDAVWG